MSKDMDIKWSYYLIALIYILVMILKLINSTLTLRFKKQNESTIKLVAVKRDFFTTVSIICIFTTIFINAAALNGGKSINAPSILITLLVVGFTLMNSFIHIFVAQKEETILLLGYSLKKGEIETIKQKERKGFTSYDITFTKEIDSYNYAKLMVFGKERNQLKATLLKLVKEN